ncbi:hypothetical protein COB64_04580 [Candidatus Wolfebacteria bacterium]|nr:MAG: hypothetical protein COB64_04580 [Candidatus Wolfebacteria bacterium]
MKKTIIMLSALLISFPMFAFEDDYSIKYLPVIHLEIGVETEIAPGVSVKVTQSDYPYTLPPHILGFVFDLTRDSIVSDTTSATTYVSILSTDGSGRVQLTYGLTIARDSSTAMISVPVGLTQLQITVNNLLIDTLYYDLIRGFADSVGFSYADPGTFRTEPIPESNVSLDIFECSSDTVFGDSIARVEFRIISNDDVTIAKVMIDTGLTVDSSSAISTAGILYGKGETSVVLSVDLKLLPLSSTYSAQVVVQNSLPGNIYSSTESCIVSLFSDIDEIESLLNKKQIFMYPNPAFDVVTIRIDQFTAGNLYAFEMFDIIGKKVITTFLLTKETRMNIGDTLPPGVYLYRLLDGQNVSSGKIVLR